jgi:hypothetical protein
MDGNGRQPAGWGYAVEGNPSTMLEVALRSLRRQGAEPRALPSCNGEACVWVRDLAECLTRGECRGAVLFCDDAGLACCVANKVPGVRAVAVAGIGPALRALHVLGANLLVVEMAGRTYYECRELLRLCREHPLVCPPGIACVLQELDGHAHR